MTQPLSFQRMILTLHDYWSQRGCLILQPYDMRMGAGTFHTATTLRALGPDPWNAAFVQPADQNAARRRPAVEVQGPDQKGDDQHHDEQSKARRPNETGRARSGGNGFSSRGFGQAQWSRR